MSNAPVVNRKLDPGTLHKSLLKLRKQVKQLQYKIVVLKTVLKNQTAELMAQLGIKGEVLPDGRFRLEDGRVIGSSFEEAIAVAEDGNPGAGRLHALTTTASPASPSANAEATRRLLHDQRAQFQSKIPVEKYGCLSR